MDGFANMMSQWHDWWWLWALENCLSGYCFIHTLALYCRQINDALSISITSYSYMHPGLVGVRISTLQVRQLNLKHFWAFLSFSVGLLCMMTFYLYKTSRQKAQATYVPVKLLNWIWLSCFRNSLPGLYHTNSFDCYSTIITSSVYHGMASAVQSF